MRLSQVALLSTISLAICFARETVYLSSGFSLTVDSHVNAGRVYVLRIGNGTVEYPAEEISEIVAIAEAATPRLDNLTQSPQGILSTAAKSEGVDEIFIRSVAKVESAFRQEAISKKGAVGLMQLMPTTASELGVDPSKADQNASGGARYLRGLLERYQYNPVLALAAYNAGPATVTRYKGLPPYYETRQYVVRVLKEYQRELKAAGVSTDATKKPSAID